MLWHGLLILCVFPLFQGCQKNSRKLPSPKNNEIRLALRSKITHLDPQLTTDVYGTQIQGQVYESLFEYDFLKRPLELAPLLADQFPETSADGKKMVFSIKPGIHYQPHPCFQKPREVTAADFVYSLHRAALPGLHSPQFSALENRVVGANEFHQKKANHIRGVRLIDSTHFEIEFIHPQPRFIYNFIGTAFPPLPEECLKNKRYDLKETTFGTGPFRLVNYIPGGLKITLEKNPHYHLSFQGKPLPFLDRVSFDVIHEDQPLWLKFMSGELDISSIPKDYIPTVLAADGEAGSELKHHNITLLRQIRSDITMFIFNLKEPVWGKKKELRQAFALAVDVPRIIRLIYADQALQAHSLVLPGSFGYDPDYRNPWAKRDVAKSKLLLKQSGYPDGKGLPPLEFLVVSSNAINRQVTEIIQSGLKETGIILKPKYVTWPELSKSTHEGNFTLTLMGNTADTPDVDTTFERFKSENSAPGPNVASYSNPQVDAWIQKIQSLNNGPERLELIQKVRDQTNEDLPYIPCVHRIGSQAMHSWVQNNVFTDEMFWGNFLKYRAIRTQEQAKP